MKDKVQFSFNNTYSQLATSLLVENIDEFYNQLEKCNTSFVEHRIDGIKDYGNFNIKYSNFPFKFIATIRSVDHGGLYKGSIDQKIELLRTAMLNGASYIDVEFELEPGIRDELIQEAHSLGVKVILSSHNFENTPDLPILNSLHKKMNILNADIIKLVCTAKSVDDGNKILKIQDQAQKNSIPTIAFAMGELGSFTRIKALTMGAPFMYVCLDKKTAPGQYSVEEMIRKLRTSLTRF